MNPNPIHLLLADDDKDDCLFFQDALEELVLPTTFTAVHNGEQLMAHLLTQTEALPTVLFLDLNMPRKNGFECLVEIKKHDKLKTLPVVIYSTSSDTDTVDLMYKNGAQYYIQKPSDFTKLKQVLENTLAQIMEMIRSEPSRESSILPI